MRLFLHQNVAGISCRWVLSIILTFLYFSHLQKWWSPWTRIICLLLPLTAQGFRIKSIFELVEIPEGKNMMEKVMTWIQTIFCWLLLIRKAQALTRSYHNKWIYSSIKKIPWKVVSLMFAFCPDQLPILGRRDSGVCIPEDATTKLAIMENSGWSGEKVKELRVKFISFIQKRYS